MIFSQLAKDRERKRESGEGGVVSIELRAGICCWEGKWLTQQVSRGRTVL